ncbi:hypothetical protein MAHJHV63_55220 [Mycobacterium avium subsp. hominissuis]
MQLTITSLADQAAAESVHRISRTASIGRASRVPFVVTPKGTRLARPIDAVREIL